MLYFSWYLLYCINLPVFFATSTGVALPHTASRFKNQVVMSSQTLSGTAGPQTEVSGVDSFLSGNPRQSRWFGRKRDPEISINSLILRDLRNKSQLESLDERKGASITTISPLNVSLLDNQAIKGGVIDKQAAGDPTTKGVPVETNLVGNQQINVAANIYLNTTSQHSGYGCHVSKDFVYNGYLVDCTHREINDVSGVTFPENSTTVMLDRNNITLLRNGSFVQLRWLRHLSIRSANVSHIEVDALAGLPLLEFLNLEANNLPISSCAFPFHMFRHVPNLRTLLIGHNSKVKGTWVGESQTTPSVKRSCGSGPVMSQYANHIDIFQDLSKLETLSIDSFKTLLLGKEFSKFENLKNLSLYCALVKSVSNASFEGLYPLNLTSLVLDTFYDYNVPIFPVGIFQPVSELASLTIHQCRIGNHNILKTMWPFELGPMKTLRLDDLKVSRYRESPALTLKDGILTKASMSHINNICLTTIEMTNSKIFSLEPDAMTSPVWLKCLKHVDLSGNELGFSGWRVVLFQISWFLYLEDVTVTSPATSYQQVHPDFTSDLDMCYMNTGNQCLNSFPGRKNPRIDERTSFHLQDFDNETKSSQDFTSHQILEETALKTNQQKTDPIGQNTAVPRAQLNFQLLNASSYLYKIPLPIVWIRMPKSIKTIRIASITLQSFVHYVTNWVLVDSDHFSELYAINIPQFCYSRGRFLGLNNLRILDVSGSMMDVGEHFYDDFPSLEVLVLSSVLPVGYFDKIVSCKRLLRNLTRLTYFDISNNGLTWLYPDTFQTNPVLSHLVLADNRFSSIPFELATTPRLQVLDLSQNAILFLSKSEISSLDDHVGRVQHFLLKLHGNGIVCVCSELNFLAWLTVSPAQFDNNGDYQCTSQSGHLSTTAAFSDIEGLWRQCEGSTAFLTSLILASLMALSFLAVLFIGRFKTAIIAVVLNIVAPQFKPKSPQDFKTSVFIGYADNDFRYVRNILLNYLEGELHSTTFIHQRDLGTGYTDQLFFEAMQDSWRILLVITSTFLGRYDIANIVMKYASHSESPVNQGRVFVLVERSQLQNIPSYLHDVLDDSRILTVSDFDLPLTYELRQSIKRCLESRG